MGVDGYRQQFFTRADRALRNPNSLPHKYVRERQNKFISLWFSGQLMSWLNEPRDVWTMIANGKDMEDLQSSGPLQRREIIIVYCTENIIFTQRVL